MESQQTPQELHEILKEKLTNTDLDESKICCICQKQEAPNFEKFILNENSFTKYKQRWNQDTYLVQVNDRLPMQKTGGIAKNRGMCRQTYHPSCL